MESSVLENRAHCDEFSLHLPNPCVRKECDYTPNNSSKLNVHLPDSHIDEEAIGPVSDMSENESQILQVDGNLTISDISAPAITIAAGSMDMSTPIPQDNTSDLQYNYRLSSGNQSKRLVDNTD